MLHQWKIDAASMIFFENFMEFVLKNLNIFKIVKILKIWNSLKSDAALLLNDNDAASLQNAMMQHHCSINVASLQYYGNTNITSSDAASLCTIGHVVLVCDK